MSGDVKKESNGFVGFLENLLLAKSVRHGFLLYFIIFNLDLILTLLGKGHIVKELTNVVPGLLLGDITSGSYKVLQYYQTDNFIKFLTICWRTLLPLACGFFIPIIFDAFQRWSIKIRIWITKKWVDLEALTIESDKLAKENINLKEEKKELLSDKKIDKDMISVLTNQINELQEHLDATYKNRLDNTERHDDGKVEYEDEIPF
jgi:hypothetical protein